MKYGDACPLPLKSITKPIIINTLYRSLTF